jgi:hypothetical protein
LHRGIWFEDREVRDKATGDIMKMQGSGMHVERAGSETNNEATDAALESPMLDQEAIARVAYFCWEARGCPSDSPDEDWFRAEAELRSRLAAAATD